MIIVLQKVKEASASVNGEVTGKIKKGVCLLVGIEKGDTKEEAWYLANKIAELRIFPDKQGKMNLSLYDVREKFWPFPNLRWRVLSRKGGDQVLITRRIHL